MISDLIKYIQKTLWKKTKFDFFYNLSDYASDVSYLFYA